MSLLLHAPFGFGRWRDGVRRVKPIEPDGGGPLPLLRTRFRLSNWLDERAFDLDACIDTGADVSVIRREWFLEHGPLPVMDHERCLVDPSFIELDGGWLDLPQLTGPIIAASEDDIVDWGSEDAILGRDFLVYHRMKLTLDFGEQAYTLSEP